MTSTNWAVRPATADDLAEIEAAVTGCGLFSEDEAAGFLDMLPGLLADPGEYWLLAHGAEGGLGAAYASRDGLSSDVWNLWFIGLDKPAQAQGGGSALLSGVEGHARGQGGRLLLVETSSAGGFADTRGFYLARGFGQEAVIRDYYSDGDDKVIFAKRL